MRLALFTVMVVGWFGLPLQARAQGAEQGRHHLTVLFTTDLYGRFTEVTCGAQRQGADFANIVTAIEKVRSDSLAKGWPAPLVLNGGDNIGPHAFARFLLSRGRAGGKQLISWLERAGYEVIGIGNHDFYAFPIRLRRYLKYGRAAGLFFSAANLDCKGTDEKLCKLVGTGSERFRMLERGGLKIAVFSVIHGDLAGHASPANLVGIQVVNPYERATELVGSARASGADLVFVLSHLDRSESSPRNALKLARAIPDADLIIANGFTSRGGERGIGIIRFADGGTPIVGSDLFGQHLGRADLVVERSQGRWRVSSLEAHELDPVRYDPDPQVRSQLDEQQAAYCEEWDKPVGQGRLLKPMDAATFENYLLEVMRHVTRSELAFMNQGLVNPRTVFPLEGNITRHDFFSGMPHRNKVYAFSLSVAELDLLCKRLAQDELKGGRQLLTRGLTCGETIKVNGRALESGETYSAATVEYLAKGMLGYFKDQTSRMTVFRPGSLDYGPILGALTRSFLSGPRFSGPEAEAIDLEANFPDLADRLRWTFQSTVVFNLADTSIDNGPGYEESQLTRDEFIALKSELRGKIAAGSSFHGFSLEAMMKYARSSTNDLPFVESEDLTTVNAIYKLNALRSINSGWYVPAPYLEGKAETELTVPDEGRDYHHLELTGVAGARFKLLPTLEAHAGIGVRREMFEPGADPVYGFDLGYELVRTDLFSLWGSPFQAESKLSMFFGDVGRSNTLKGTWVNRLYFALVGPIFFNITHALFVFRYSDRPYALASDLTFGLSYHARTALQMF